MTSFQVAKFSVLNMIQKAKALSSYFKMLIPSLKIIINLAKF